MKSSMRIIVVGLGIVGSSIASYLGEKGYKVKAFDAHTPPHSLGSSHGENRLFRRTPGEGDDYAMMAEKSYQKWLKINEEAQEPIFYQSGCIDIGDDETLWAYHSVAASKKYGGDTRLISVAEAEKHLPYLKFSNDMQAAYTPSSGHTQAEGSVSFFFQKAGQCGVEIFTNTKIENIDRGKKEIIDQNGQKHGYDLIILACGSWISQICPMPVHVEKRVLGWYSLPSITEDLSAFTLNIKSKTMYGMPSHGTLFKIADMNHLSENLGCDDPLNVTDKDKSFLNETVQKYLKNIPQKADQYAACKYTLTSDNNFIIDRYDNETVIFSPCSGHGFKYAPLYGEIAESFVQGKESDLSFIKRFKLSRFR